MRGTTKSTCVRLLLALSATALLTTGCLTPIVWEKDRDIPTYGRVLLTPVAVAADAAIVGAYVFGMAYGSGGYSGSLPTMNASR
jgi:hypothetical protein